MQIETQRIKNYFKSFLKCEVGASERNTDFGQSKPHPRLLKNKNKKLRIFDLSINPIQMALFMRQ